MVRFEVIFYEDFKGTCPVELFINSLNIKMRAKVFGLLELLEEKGYQLREPYSKKIDQEIFELRCIQGNTLVRILYFFQTGGKIIITNGFVKKQQKTPKRDIEIDNAYRRDYLERAIYYENIEVSA